VSEEDEDDKDTEKERGSRLDGWPEKVSKSKPYTGRMIYFWGPW